MVSPDSEIGRSASGASFPELQQNLATLTQSFTHEHNLDITEAIHQKIHAGHCVRQIILDDSTSRQGKEQFRNRHGFQAFHTALANVTQACSNDALDDEQQRLLFDYLRVLFGILSAALHDHEGNQRFFRRRVDDGGWQSLQRILAQIVQADRQARGVQHRALIECILGCLLACALNDEYMGSLFSRIGSLRDESLTRTADGHDSEASKPGLSEDLESLTLSKGNDGDGEMQSVLTTGIDASAFVHNPEALSMMLELWKVLRNDLLTQDHRGLSPFLVAPGVISRLAGLSTHNLHAIHGTPLLGTALSLLLTAPAKAKELSDIRLLVRSLLQFGIGNLEDAHLLYRAAASSSLVAETLLQALKMSQCPSFIHFDLSMHGYASVELPSIGRDFPPTSPSSGYTLTMWLHVVIFDPNAHTTIFGAFDASQTCFMLVYLEKDTHNLILQTSVTSSRPSVRFKSMAFRDRHWYHIAIVHRRPRTTMSSRASLFVDGRFVEQVKSNYPEQPPSSGSNLAAMNGNRRSNPVQAFLGTPQDLAARLGKGLVSSQWRLASAHLFAEALSDDLLAVYHQIGPRYYGNYQDRLGSFQTYEASAHLNLLNESLHLGKEAESDLVIAIRDYASKILPESLLILNIAPSSILNADNDSSINQKQLLKGLGKQTGKNLRHVTQGGNAIIVNGAIPAIHEALHHSPGFAVLTGDPVIVVPRGLDDAAWRIGGCAAVGLSLFEAANSPHDIKTTLDILLETIKGSWRNSEAVEKENGFGVLATLLANKLSLSKATMSYNNDQRLSDADGQEQHEKLAIEVLSTILRFLGYHPERPQDSVINNPLAYRTLLVDPDLWRQSSPAVQRLYYRQFVVFGSDSKYRAFNSKRLSKMRIAKKWVDALKADVFYSDTFDLFLDAFRTVLTAHPASESLRSLALFITYAIHRPVTRNASPLRPTKSIRYKDAGTPRRQTLVTASPSPLHQRSNVSEELTRTQIAMRILRMYTSIICDNRDTVNIRKFARTVTNRWLLFLIANNDPTVVALATKILARLLVVNGPSYMKKFDEKTGGIVIMQRHLKRWWSIPSIWPLCFAILFGQDVASINLDRDFDFYNLMEALNANERTAVVYPQILPVLTNMLQNGLRAITKDQIDPDSPLNERLSHNGSERNGESRRTSTHKRSPSMSLKNQLAPLDTSNSSEDNIAEAAAIIHTVSRFLADIHTRSQAFRDFAVTSTYVQELLLVLFPIVVSSDVVSPEAELHSRDTSLNFGGNDVFIKPLSQGSLIEPPIIRTASADGPEGSRTGRVKAPRRMSSYVFISAEKLQRRPPVAKHEPDNSHARGTSRNTTNAKTSITEELLEILVSVFSDQLFMRKDFPGLGLFMKVPPGFQEHQAYFETFVLRNTLSHLKNAVMLDQSLLVEPRVLTNLARFATHLSEAVYEGWFIDGVDAILEFLGIILEHIQLPEIAKMKSIRLCSQPIAVMRAVLVRVVLLKLSELDDDLNPSEIVSFLEKLVYWQTVVLVTQDGQDYYLRLLCYLLYTKLVGTQDSIRTAAANLWRMLLVQRPHYASDFLQEALGNHDTPLSKGFSKIMEVDNETFLGWIDDHRDELDVVFLGGLAKGWDSFVAEENRRTEDNSKARINKRKDRLKVWQTEHFASEEILRKHSLSADHWSANIFDSEHMRRQRAQQDQQDDYTFNTSTWHKMSQELRRPRGLLEDTNGVRWQLDQTEGRNRMRMRCIPDRHDKALSIKPKRKQSQGPTRHRSTLSSRQRNLSREPSGGSSHLRVPSSSQTTEDESAAGAITPPEPNEEELEQEEDFEIVEDPQDEFGSYDDKNRRVMRSLHRGDQVEHVLNVSRIIGLEACEGLLILGTRFLYVLDNLFQRSDGEIVNVWQAPQLERDPYVQMISGREASERPPSAINTNLETRNWPWEDVLSISKRRFLFREVAIEVFFVDGRSYLLTSSTPAQRDELYEKLQQKALNVADRAPVASQEGAWRIESIKNPEDESQTLGSRFTNVFAQSYSNPATRKWVKGEISNFHYLMLVNTMAGRTFNDLTQYPVFPWVLADYTSEELDLTDPRSYRDLTKPMGCQTPERQAEFRERYHVFAEMGNENQPPFHYGTHYSSAMIVTSYLIRLQPFVQSYLLLQGGSFDHPDRLFYSIEKAWASASRDNMTDVRELIPEFYYLPEFLLNSNEFDFGLRQGDGGAIDTVVLPPWAKGDPKIFIAKNREALESEHVSKHLHQWIDLIFGHKQQGEAAFEATNIFHHLSYHGAKDLETIEDPVERLATIGIIHNFGQTPFQVFHKGHPPREDKKQRIRRLDTTAEGLTRLPSPVLESNERVHALYYSTKHDRVMCSSFFRLPLTPAFDKFMEWGYIDDSIRFYMADSKRVGQFNRPNKHDASDAPQLISLSEHVHTGQLSTALFVDANTLVTAGTDCTISVWAVPHAGKSVELQPKACLFGHRAAIDVLAVSKSFSTLLSADSNGEVLMWDLNRLKIVRVLTSGKPVECARINDVSGTVMLCRGRTVSLFTLNGDPVLTQDVCHESDDTITACAFYQGAGNEFLERNLVFTGHKRGLVNVWNHISKSGIFVLEHIKRMDHLDQAGFNVNAAMTAVLPMPHTVYTGDEDGRVYEWDCIQRQ